PHRWRAGHTRRDSAHGRAAAARLGRDALSTVPSTGSRGGALLWRHGACIVGQRRRISTRRSRRDGRDCRDRALEHGRRLRRGPGALPCGGPGAHPALTGLEVKAMSMTRVLLALVAVLVLTLPM